MSTSTNAKPGSFLLNVLLCGSLLLGSSLLADVVYNARNEVPKIEAKVRVDKKLGGQIPSNLKFVDDKGQAVSLGNYMGANPLVLAMVYYECPSICGLLMTGLFRALRQLEFKPGTQYDLLLVSIDPGEGTDLAKAKKENFLKKYDMVAHGQGVHFLTADQENITALADTIGFRYEYDEKTDQYAHPAFAVVVTPEGKISQYHPGVEFKKKDLRLSLVTASGNQIGSAVDHFFLYCYRYDPTTGKYGLVVMNALRLMGIVTLLGIGMGILLLLFRERQKARMSAT